ncbi:MAG: hypothetical protein JSW48_02115, partial [Betaproteobacteria bacterium]
VLCHEALHCALSHFARRGHRQRHLWDIACDLAINPILVREGLTPPPGSLLEPGYENMSAEEIYLYLADNPPDEDTLDQHLYDTDPQEQSNNELPLDQSSEPQQNDGANGGQGQARDYRREPRPLDSSERDALSIQWQQRVASAAQQARQAGKLSRHLARLADHLLQPQLPWRMLLARYMSGFAKEQHSYARPSTRRGDPAIFPSLRGSQIELALALDVSGSISVDELSGFVAEVNAIQGQLKARVTVFVCDNRLRDDPWIFEPWETLELPDELPYGGGTDFRPVFDRLHAADVPPDVLVYFTDAQGQFPESAPHYPVIWLVKGTSPVPWGDRIQLN